ncbi:hypothetical protein FOL47_004600 [Perkinsus chesapeaki]|uniref:carnosine N-methyltransferase n=1 Tax=Perkinsus chesapeaki TaxID=330153 RepID=A0A7J6M1J8_PERCH|nr:hypothetical protein FOL47_004600 [Perkinsus chesapeaki]
MAPGRSNNKKKNAHNKRGKNKPTHHVEEPGSPGEGRSPLDPEEYAEEKRHFNEVVWSFETYGDDFEMELNALETSLMSLNDEELELWGGNPEQYMKDIRERMAVNQRVCHLLSEVSTQMFGDTTPRAAARAIKPPKGYQSQPRNISKVRSTLRQFVREWSVEGEKERSQCFNPVIDALKRYVPAGGRVIVPGCGMGRSVLEVCAAGYEAIGNEFSYHMLIASSLMLNVGLDKFSMLVYPYLMSLGGRRGKDDHLRGIQVPDVSAYEMACNTTGSMGMTAGEFVETFCGHEHLNAWDAVASIFFIDTAKNVVQYIRILAHCIKPGGVFINIGPLLWHFAESKNDISIELSWEDVRQLLEVYFDIVEEKRLDANYASNLDSLSESLFHCIFYVARRNNRPVEGESNSVYIFDELEERQRRQEAGGGSGAAADSVLSSYPVQHCVDGDKCVNRGVIKVDEGKVSLQQNSEYLRKYGPLLRDKVLNKENLGDDSLVELRVFYDEGKYVQSSIPVKVFRETLQTPTIGASSTSLAAKSASLTEHITLHLDDEGRLESVGYRVRKTLGAPLFQVSTATLHSMTVTKGPAIPVPKKRVPKAAAQSGANRSGSNESEQAAASQATQLEEGEYEVEEKPETEQGFLRKYWWVLLIFFLLSSAMGQEEDPKQAAAGAGGAAKGGNGGK